MYRHIDKVEKYIGRPIVRLKSHQSFEYLFYDYSPKRANPKLEQYRGFSWPGPRNRWCTAMLKTRIISQYLRELSKEYTLVQYIGIAADEPKRIREHRYPLVEWGMTEADCLDYCRERGFTTSSIVCPAGAVRCNLMMRCESCVSTSRNCGRSLCIWMSIPGAPSLRATQPNNWIPALLLRMS